MPISRPLIELSGDHPAEGKVGVFDWLIFIGLIFMANEFILKSSDDVVNGVLMFVGISGVAVMYKKVFFVVSLLVAIGLGREFVFMGIGNLRVEDFVILFCCPMVIMRADIATDEERKKTNALIRVYFFFLLLSTLRGIIEGYVWGLGMAIPYYLKYVEFFFIYYLVTYSIKNAAELKFVMSGSLVVCLFVAYLSYQSWVTKSTEISGILIRAYGPQGETPNVLGGYYIENIMIAAALFFAVKRWYYKLLLVCFVLAIALPFLYTYSRTSFVSFVAGMIVIIVFVDLRYSVILALACIFIPILFPVDVVEDLVGVNTIDRYKTIFSIFTPGEKVSSWNARVLGWYIYFTGTLYTTPLLGRGMGSIWLGIDSAYVKKFVEGGVVGLLLFLSILFRFCKVGLRVAKLREKPYSRSIGVASVGVTVCMLVHGIGVSTFSTIRTAALYYLIMGICFAAYSIHQKEEEKQDWQEELSFQKK